MVMPEDCQYSGTCPLYHKDGVMCNQLIGQRWVNCDQYKHYRRLVETKPTTTIRGGVFKRDFEVKQGMLERFLGWFRK